MAVILLNSEGLVLGKWSRVDTFTEEKGFELEWEFIPPRPTHHGGLWKAAVKLVKFHLSRVIGCNTCTFEECAMIAAQIEGILNSRYLFELSGDGDMLTPDHFLIGRPFIAIPEIPKTVVNKTRRLEMMQQSVLAFWKAWRSDILPNVKCETSDTGPAVLLMWGTFCF